MTFNKQSQLSLDGKDVPAALQKDDHEIVVDDNMLAGPLVDELEESYGDVEVSPNDVVIEVNDVAIEVESDGPTKLTLTLDKIPGGMDQTEIEEPESIEVEESEDVEVSDDPWSWTVKNFIEWLSGKMNSVPSHSGRDTVGLERAISYLEQVDREISRAVRMDLNNEIAIDAVEKARDEIQRGLERLEERLEKVKSHKYPRKTKNKKKADEEYEGLVKEAQKAAYTGGMVVSVPLFISHLARVLINGTVSAGHDMEDMFVKLSKKYDLTGREKAEVVQLLQDMNYPIRRDRGFSLDEEIDTTSSDNFDWMPNYHA